MLTSHPPQSADSPQTLLSACRERGLSLATAESLTAGALVARLVDVPGASRVVVGGVCTYSLESKASLLGLDLHDLQERGAVRAEVATAMARGALKMYRAHMALSTTGVAGPGADEFSNPEGLAFIACARRDGTDVRLRVRELHCSGDRASIRAHVVQASIALALEDLHDEHRHTNAV